jgi:membrane-associated phospholipid phosphatase
MLLIDLQAYAVAGALLIGSENVFARARPSQRPCELDASYETYCGAADEKSSFISGHTGVVATSAGLICAHHQYLHLYGNDFADALACGIGIGAALTTGIARIINDRHYATDTLAAFSVGALSGYALPVLRYYRASDSEAAWSAHWLILPDVTRSSAGLSLHGAL